MAQIVGFYQGYAEEDSILSDSACSIVMSLPILLFPYVPATALRLWKSFQTNIDMKECLWTPFLLEGNPMEGLTASDLIIHIKEAFPILKEEEVTDFLKKLSELKIDAKSCFLTQQSE